MMFIEKVKFISSTQQRLASLLNNKLCFLRGNLEGAGIDTGTRTELGRNTWKAVISLLVIGLGFNNQYPSLLEYREKISKGENLQIMESSNSEAASQLLTHKAAGKTAWGTGNWDQAIANYSLATQTDPNDPESLIYLNNAKARKTGNSLTIAIVVPISSQTDIAKEWLRGVALAQQEFNHAQIPPAEPIEIMIVDSADLRLDIPNRLLSYKTLHNIQGVVVYGSDEMSRDVASAIGKVKLPLLKGLPVISLHNIDIRHEINRFNQNSAGKTSAHNEDDLTLDYHRSYLEQAGNDLAKELHRRYVKESGNSLAKGLHGGKKWRVAVYYDQDQSFGNKIFQESFVNGLKDPKVEIVNGDGQGLPIDDFDASEELVQIKAGGGVQKIFLASSNVDQTVAIARANEKLGKGEQFLLVGREELYQPKLLQKGASAVEGMILAVPWGWQPCDTELSCPDHFSKETMTFWRGRVSWRTKSAHSSMSHILAHARGSGRSNAKAHKRLKGGVRFSKKLVDSSFNPNNLALVEVQQGEGGPNSLRLGKSAYQFDVIDPRQKENVAK